jgi:hypothetical protein
VGMVLGARGVGARLAAAHQLGVSADAEGLIEEDTIKLVRNICGSAMFFSYVLAPQNRGGALRLGTPDALPGARTHETGAFLRNGLQLRRARQKGLCSGAAQAGVSEELRFFVAACSLPCLLARSDAWRHYVNDVLLFVGIFCSLLNQCPTPCDLRANCDYAV